MGIKLGKILTGKNTIDMSFQGKKVAVDALNTLMIFLKRKYRNTTSSSINTPEYVTDKTQRAISHLYGIFYRTIKFLECGIIPVYCFDGKPDRLKRIISNNEYDYFLKLKQKYSDAINKFDILILEPL